MTPCARTHLPPAQRRRGLAPGTYLGSVRELTTLRDRCVCDRATGCWHLRSADGKVLRNCTADAPKVHVFGRGKVSARRAAIEFARGEALPQALLVAACSKAADCVNPQHLRAMTKAALGQRMRRTGAASTPAKRAANRRTAQKRRHVLLTPELATWARESRQTQREVAHGLGIRQQCVSEIRAGKAWRSPTELPSVFDWRPA